MDNLNLLSQLRESLVNALREIRAGNLKRAIHEVEDAFATSTSMLVLQPQGGGAGGPAVMQQDGGGSARVTIPGQGGHDGRNLQPGVHEFPSQGAAGPPGYSGKVHHVGPGIYREGPGLSLDEAWSIQRAAAGGGHHPGQTGLEGQATQGGPGMTGLGETIQVRKTPEWQMNLAKVTQARYIADLMVMEAWAVDYASESIERRIHDELYKEFDAFDDRLLQELKDGQGRQ